MSREELQGIMAEKSHQDAFVLRIAPSGRDRVVEALHGNQIYYRVV